MMYIFKDTLLVHQVEASGYSVQGFNDAYRKRIPTDSCIYDSWEKKWYVKRTRARVRPLPEGMIPKECKMMLLLLGVPCG